METLLQIIGFGPAALGLFITADRTGQLHSLLERGVQVHERSASLAQWNCLAYDIEANSPIEDFLKGIRVDGVFAECLNQPMVQRWLQAPGNVVQLTDVSIFLRQLAEIVVALCAGHPRAAIHFGHNVDAVTVVSSGFCVTGDWGIRSSRYLVLACGARIRDLQMSAGTAQQPGSPPICSDRLLRGQADAQLRESLAQGQRVLVVGGSHSAFSAVGYLLERFHDCLAPQAIAVLCRRRPALWSASSPGARLLKATDVVDEESGEVNRFCGLRGAAQQTLLSVEAGQQPSVALHIGDADIEPWLEDGFLLINATGYLPRLPALFDQQGTAMTLDQLEGNLCKHRNTGELMVQGVAVGGLFGTGLGFSDRRGETLEVGVNFFHGRCASHILQAVL
ncbi:hypothetical protein J3P89_15355 [Pseudomonas sp. Z1-14]|jgi:hypothetical protein|uniref:hypothetical protein n=1 Tax=Pseudomonas sp. Z1-14 TaxID=2817409 RepID=UPI003DA80EF7